MRRVNFRKHVGCYRDTDYVISSMDGTIERRLGIGKRETDRAQGAQRFVIMARQLSLEKSLHCLLGDRQKKYTRGEINWLPKVDRFFVLLSFLQFAKPSLPVLDGETSR